MLRGPERPSRSTRALNIAAILRDAGSRLLLRMRPACSARGETLMTPAPVIRLHPDDGVLIARASLPSGTVVEDGVTTIGRIPAGHKVAVRPIAVGEPVRRYGQIIGFATAP